MKPLRLNIATFALWSALTLLAGCTHKKPVLVAPQPLPPPPAAEPSPTPEPAQPTEKTEQAQDAQAPSPDQTKPDTAQADKSKHPPKPSPRKPARKVIDADKSEPAPAAGQVSPAPNAADASHAQGSTEQLLKSAEANLNSINRQLSKDEEAKRSQALQFIAQSRKATDENDSTRAYNLAVKARLLSDELVQQR